MQSEEQFQERGRRYAQHARHLHVFMRFLTVILVLAAIVAWALATVGDGDYIFVAIGISLFTCFWLSLELLLRSHTEMILAIYEQNHDLARSQRNQQG